MERRCDYLLLRWVFTGQFINFVPYVGGGKLYPRHEKQTKNPAERTGSRYKIEILMSRTQKLKGLVAASLRLKTFNDNP